jgi:superfamily II DNA or RNA helicase
MNAYIGPKGYSVYKNSISIQTQHKIRADLTVGPYIPKAASQPPKFPVYRESSGKLYIPRHYGIATLGNITESKLPIPDSICVPFKGNVRDYQIPIINSFVNNCLSGGSGGLIEVGCGQGKTVMALNIISCMKVKTLVIVHKEFLLNQWVERIKEFLPSATIGKIQGQVIDIDGKDIVIGMLQSLSMKDYPDSMFNCFGLTIIDETHHIGAEVFVRSLFKIVSYYMLGLSATMDRKDGLTKVFKMFLGEVLFKMPPTTNDNVLVKKYEFHSDDTEFNDVVFNYRGDPQYSTMISKLCKFKPRIDFIIRILTDEFNSDNKQQFIILAHQKQLLLELFNRISLHNIATVGYYVGGMKEKELNLSETKNVILATYSMAAEALDIKSLTTLIMATPQTDVRQSIGRILRTNHSRPLVIDIVDVHDLFQRQFLKRATYYRKQNYKIIQTSNKHYGTFNEILKSKKKITSEISSGVCLLLDTGAIQ